MTPATLQEVTGFTSLAVAILSLIHAYFGRVWRGHGMGYAISLFSSVLPTFGSAILLLVAIGSLLSLYLHDLLTNAELAGSKNEVLLSVLGIITLCWTGILGTDRRRRIVASKLASIPCFGNGYHVLNHQLLNLDKSSMLLFDPKFISSQMSPSNNNMEKNNAHIASTGTTPEKSCGERSITSTSSSRKRKVREFPCRTAATWIQGRAKKQAWPLNVVRTFKTHGKRFLLIKDSTIQDEAGAVLLNPNFVSSRHIDKKQIAHVVFKAVQRSTPCAIHTWNKKFDGKLFEQFSEIPAVAGMLTGEIRKDLEQRLSREGSIAQDSSRCYMTEIMWAIIVVEVLDYLQYKRRDLPFLSWFVSLPLWFCGGDPSKIEQNVDSVFSSWKAGRICGKLLSKPCDSECCCHGLSRQSFCDCQCQCICNCSRC